MSEYRNPYPTTDVIVEMLGGIVLIERSGEPKGWALPGGFVDYGESVEDGARREVLEETGLTVHLEALLGVYSAPDRDPRQHNLSVVYIGQATGLLRSGDDAKDARIFSLDALPSPLCFDHAHILEDYRRYLADGTLPSPSNPKQSL